MAGAVLAGALVVWLFGPQSPFRGFDWSLAAAAMVRLRWPWLLLSLAMVAGSYYGRVLRWAVFLKPLKARPSIRNLLSATVIGFAAIALFGRPGEVVRPYLIAVKERVPVSSQFAAWLLERIFDLLMALLIFGFALTRVRASGARVGPRLAGVLAVGGRLAGFTSVAVLIVLLSLRHFAEPLRRRLIAGLRLLPKAHFLKAEKLVNAFVQGVESMRSDGALLLVFMYSVVEWALIVGCFLCLARSFVGTASLSFVDVLVLVGFVSFGTIIQIPGIGGGMQVVAVVVLTELFAVRLEVATAFAMLAWIITFVAIVPVGFGLALKEGLDWHSLRQIGRETSA
ncbi:MAG: lysylphosphatidylglycerol synthase transmembrane domain-containing protein [Bryobacteraceae bacterium]